MAAHAYQFRSMSVDDLPQVQCWLAMPHVMQWWGNIEKEFALVRDDLDHPAMDQFIVPADDSAIGYLQCYDPAGWPEQPFGPQPEGTRGIDQFIGEPDMINCGHGSAFIRAFIEGLLANGTPLVVTDPDPNNMRAVRAYEKAGFRKDRLVDTPDGISLLMVRST